jgi:hypothetical protein
MCAAFISPLPALYIIRQSSLKHCVSLSITPDAWIGCSAHTAALCVPSACEREGERVEIAAASKSEQAKKCLCASHLLDSTCWTDTIEVPINANKAPSQLAIWLRSEFSWIFISQFFLSNIYLPCGMTKIKGYYGLYSWSFYRKIIDIIDMDIPSNFLS